MMRPRFAAGVIVVSLGAGVAIVALHPSVDAALIAAIALVCTVPIVKRMISGRFDVFEPIVIANLALMVMYVGRPAAMLAGSSQHMFKSYDITSHLREALVLALVGAIAMQLGYASGFPRRAAARLPTARGHWDVTSTLAFSGVLIALALLLFGMFLLQSGGLSMLANLIRGRSDTQDMLFRNSSAYLYAAPALFWPASLLLFAVGFAERRRDLVCLGFVPMIALGVFASGQGSRITLLPLLLAPAVCYYLSRDRRPATFSLLFVGYLVFTIGIAYFRETRTQSVRVDRVAELKSAVTDPTYEYRQLIFHGVDNDMFESLAAETIVVPARLNASPFEFVYRTLAKPIPSAIWSGKPLAPEEELTHALYPEEHVRASSSAGVIGSFFLAGELPGVMLGMGLVGWMFRLPWEYWRRFPAESGSQLFLAASLMFIPILLRGGVGDTLSRVLFGVVPLFIAVHLCQKPHWTTATIRPLAGAILPARANR
jgi:hypothetical protein